MPIRPRLVLLALALLLTAAGDILSAPAQHPSWFKQSFLDLAEDVAEATAADRRLMLYFYQDGCPYCALLLRVNLADPEIARLAHERFEVIALNIWGDREVVGLDGQTTTEKGLAAALGVQFTPTLLLLDEAGAVVLRINGYQPPARLAAALAYVAERREQFGERFVDFHARRGGPPASGELHHETGFLEPPLRLADNRDRSPRPLVVLFEQRTCRGCDRLHDDLLRRPALGAALSAFDVALVDIDAETPLQTPDGAARAARDWAEALGILYTPTLVFFDAAGREVFRAEGELRAFHLHGALDYVATGAYRWQPSFQRYLAARRERIEALGVEVELME